MPIVRDLTRDLTRSLTRDATAARYGVTASAIVYSLLAANNASNTAPLTALTGTTLTQVATSPVTVPLYTDTSGASALLQTVPAGYPVIPYARISYDTANGAVLTDKITNGSFATDTGWVKGTNVTIDGGVAVFAASPANGERLSQVALGSVTTNKRHSVTYTIVSLTSGSIRARLYSNQFGLVRSAPGTYTETFTCPSTVNDATFGFWVQTDFTGTIDNVFCYEITPAYLPTTSLGASLATGTVLASGITRYTGGGQGNPGLAVLAEPAATNLCLQSNGFDTTWNQAGSPGLAQNQTSPFGTANTAWTLTDAAAGALAFVWQNITSVSGQTYTGSVYIKKTVGALSVFPAITLFDPTNNRITYVAIDTTNGTLTENTSYTGLTYVNATAKSIVSNGDYWRVSLSAVVTGSTAYRFSLFPASKTSLADPTSVAEDAAQGSIVIYGAQLETGSVATTYIPTTTAAVTRAARYTTAAGAEIGSKITLDATPYELGREQYLLGGTTGKIYQGSDNKIYATDGTTTLVSTSLMVANTTAIIGVDFAGGKLYINGVQEDSDVALNPTWGAAPQLGANGSGASVFNGTISVLQSSSDALFDAGGLT